MPVEIKQLVVKGKMEGDQESENKTSAGAKTEKGESTGGLSYGLRKQIVDQCVQEVMDRIKKMNDF